jgi:hypothetical protein
MERNILFLKTKRERKKNNWKKGYIKKTNIRINRMTISINISKIGQNNNCSCSIVKKKKDYKECKISYINKLIIQFLLMLI